TFSWVYTANTSGVINFTATSSGTDANTGTNVTSGALTTSNNVTIVNAGNIISSISMMPATVSTGQLITVIMNVTNNGTGNVNGVAGGSITTAGTGVISPVSGPLPVSQAIVNGASGTITWVYIASAPGTAWVSSNATG